MAAGLALFLPAACGGSADGSAAGASELLSKVVVKGAVGARPTLSFDTPVRLASSGWRVVTGGAGAPIRVDEQFLLQLTLVNGRTGRPAISTLDPGQTAKVLRSSDEGLFPVLQKALVGRRQGARILVAAAARDAFGEVGAPQYGIKPGDPLMMVADVIAVPPTRVLSGPAGTPVKPARLVPRLVERAGSVVGFRFPGKIMRKPDHLVVVPLVEGTGPPARAASLVTIDALGQLWGSGHVVMSTYGKEPMTFALGTGNVIRAWDRALVGVRRGSRVLVLTPPSLAFNKTGQPPEIPGYATIAYVIDVLGVS
ncbi:MAG: FKBP-type peptidyl-prolyl cis-trans isomerase [Actinomycetota bacterium]|nr:FKBP-type peptidyl-prolyl cis-trans isomerase [Actinomycetota bacterium]